VSLLERVRRLRPVQFRYREEIDPGQPLRAGFIAQEVKEIFPEAVREVGGVLMLDMDVLSAIVEQAKQEYRDSILLESAHRFN